ncbi:hypothetical protein JK628_23155 (plasmid) [Shewanella sp. KX20019]|uniref:hypothetical protein n=1 Tax=Shewanella sp. KX20019 TaxID=2803864 RepID=UPI00192777F8|nr:hypothetical protein [Shewanella sp. KX20019]QQX82682.1 hypothetical protein JK628_23155 [Shewanella sp. KX20019]
MKNSENESNELSVEAIKNLSFDVPAIEIQKARAAEIDLKLEQATSHILNEVLERPKVIPASWLDSGNPNYTAPGAEEVAILINSIIKNQNVTKADLARLIGVSPKHNRTLNAMIKGVSFPTYSQWRLLLVLSGKITVLRIENK